MHRDVLQRLRRARPDNLPDRAGEGDLHTGDDRRGRPVAAPYTLPVRWVLPSGPKEVTAAQADTEVELTVSVDDKGEVLACNSKATPALPVQFDPCTPFPVGKLSQLQWLREGRPVGGTLVRTYRQRITLDP